MFRCRYRLGTLLLGAASSIGCSGHAAAPAPAPAATARSDSTRPPRVVTVRDTALEHEAASLRLQLLERDAQVADLQRRLDEAMTEVVRAMARMRTLATRAEAASAMAEAEVALQQLGASGNQGRNDPPPDVVQARTLLRNASGEFDKENYGGALYLANEAKRAATAARSRIASAGGPARADETPFVVPVPLEATDRSNVRAGPGTSYDVVATVDPATPLTGVGYTQDWVHVTLADGRGAWIFAALVQARQ